MNNNNYGCLVEDDHSKFCERCNNLRPRNLFARIPDPLAFGHTVEDHICKPCRQGKAHRNKYPGKTKTEVVLLEQKEAERERLLNSELNFKNLKPNNHN